jgi:predicted site-specific integrase-resolvase
MGRKMKTAEAAKKAGISRVTLQRWLKDGRIKNAPPSVIGENGRAVRLWSVAQVAELGKLRERARKEVKQ